MMMTILILLITFVTATIVQGDDKDSSSFEFSFVSVHLSDPRRSGPLYREMVQVWIHISMKIASRRKGSKLWHWPSWSIVMVIYLMVIIEFRQEEMLKLKMLQATPQFSTQPTGVVEFRYWGQQLRWFCTNFIQEKFFHQFSSRKISHQFSSGKASTAINSLLSFALHRR